MKRVGKADEVHELIRDHYVANAVPRGEDKSVVGRLRVKHPGCLSEGVASDLRVSNQQLFGVVSTVLALIVGATTQLLHFQVFSGKLVHVLQSCSPL